MAFKQARWALFLAFLVAFATGCSQKSTQKQALTTPVTVDDVYEVPVQFKYGSYEQIQWRPAIYPFDGVQYDLFYYIPQALQGTKDFPMLIFLHGGGESTTTREGSIAAIGKYKKTVLELADTLGAAVIFPSGSGMNWGTHTPFYMRALIKMLRNSLPIDSNRIGIAGHSMGGMAMTRNFYELTDQVSFVFALAAGIATPLESTLRTHFNLPYYHLQGRKDAFDVFVTRCETHAQIVHELEDKFGQASKFTMEITPDDDHSSVLKQLTQRTKILFGTPRDLYQRKLFGQFVQAPIKTEVDVKQKITTYPRDRYFWAEAAEYRPSNKSKMITFIAEVKDNVFQIQFDNPNDTPKKMIIYLSKKMVDLDKPVQIIVNGTDVSPTQKRIPIVGMINRMLQDPGFLFEEEAIVEIPDVVSANAIL